MRVRIIGVLAGLAGVLAASACSATGGETPAAAAQATDTSSRPAYGQNPSVGKTFTHDGVTLYYEEYGQGEPLLLVHGNGASIGSFAAQIDHFKRAYRVIAMDSRDQGKSGDSPGALTYEKMTDDLAALLDHLRIDRAHVVGWSDGGIEALLLGVRHPARVNKLVAMAANLTPGADALYPETLKLFDEIVAAMPDSIKQSAAGKRSLKAIEMMYREPNITPATLGTIVAPTLVIAADHDLIKVSHTMKIFEALPNAQLAIVPGATHALPYDDPAAFNGLVDRFLKTPFKRADRIADFMASYEKLLAEMAH